MTSPTSPPSSLSPGPASLNILGPPPDFVHQLDEKYICPVCHGVLRHPIQTSCGHRLCEPCFQGLLQTEGEPLLCPVQEDTCEKVSRDDGTVMADFCARRELKVLLVYCTYKKYGCTEVMKWSLLENHLKDCLYAKVPCPFTSNGCTVMLKPEDLDSHVQDECPYRLVMCNYCNQRVVWSDLQNHQTVECPESEVPCPYNCGEQAIPRNEVDRHKLSCPIRPKRCNFKEVGCTYEGSETSLVSHTKEAVEYHLGLITVRLAEMDASRSDLKKQLHEVNYEKDLFRNKVDSLKSEVKDLKGHVERKDRMLTDLQRLVATQSERLKSLETAQDQMKKSLFSSLVENTHQLETRLHKLETVAPAKNNAPVHSPHIDKEVGILNVRLAELDSKLEEMKTTSYDGTLLWKITNYSRHKEDAQLGHTLSLCSQAFYSSQYGYKMCARIYLNGDGMGRDTHVSLFFVLLQGDNDALLPWPFKQKVTLMLLDQRRSRRHLTDMFRPDPVSSSFQRPRTEMNVASGCPMFVSHSILEAADSPYIIEDTIYIKVVVDTADLYGP